MNHKKSEKGQAIILIVFAIVGLVGLTGLTVDGGLVYADRRQAQNAADSAALAAALAKIRSQNFSNAGFALAASNGYTNDGVLSTVTINNPPVVGDCNPNDTPTPYVGNNEYIQVIIRSNVNTSFGRVVGIAQVLNCVEAISRAEPPKGGGGNAAIFAGSETCQNAIDWSGSNVEIFGGVTSNNDVKVGGSDNYVEGILNYVTSIDGPADKITYNPPAPANPVQTSPKDYPAIFDINDYAPGGSKAAAALSAGKYYSCNCKMDIGWLKSNGMYNDSTDTLKDGLYYTTGEIDLSASDIIGNAVTLVARDKVSFSGSSHTLSPYMDGLLVFTDAEGSNQCNTAVVKMSGSSHNWGGIIYAPNGLIEMSGSSNTSVNGSLIGNTVKVNGSGISIVYDSSLMPSDPPKIELTK